MVETPEQRAERRKTRPLTRAALGRYVRDFLGLSVPSRRVCECHDSPLDYLWHVFGHDAGSGRRARSGDAIVWANRAGGKTELGGVATFLDLVFKPGCQVRILGGSGEQSRRMYGYLAGFFRGDFAAAIKPPLLKTRCTLRNGSGAEILTQSDTSVRGTHVQKLRCDEVELFDPEVLSAAKFITQSAPGIRAGLEMLSTMHRPYGLMQQEVSAASRRGVRIFKWCLWETIQRCRRRSCRSCPLDPDCQGKARRADGYLDIDDVIATMRRTSRRAWEAEMLCLRPSGDTAVFGEFYPAVHVQPLEYDAGLPLYRTIDFGFVNPFVCLWAQVHPDGTVRVLDEYVRRQGTIPAHHHAMLAQTPCPEERVAATYCDPAGEAAGQVDGVSCTRALRALGMALRHRRSSIGEGLELIRRALLPGTGRVGLLVDPRCVRLIEALECYHYPDGGSAAEAPCKDGVYDHPIDALRYFFVNRARGSRLRACHY